MECQLFLGYFSLNSYGCTKFVTCSSEAMVIQLWNNDCYTYVVCLKFNLGLKKICLIYMELAVCCHPYICARMYLVSNIKRI